MTQKHYSRWRTLSTTLIVSVLVTWAWIYILNNDLLHQWHQLPSAPATSFELVTIWETTLYIKATDGQIYAIEPDRDRIWRSVNAIIPSDDQYRSHRVFIGDCDRADQRFRWTAAAPPDEIECLEAKSLISVGVFTLSVIRDTKDQLWYFQTGGSDFFLTGIESVIFVFIAAGCITYSIHRAIFG
jgi:hypothetical protein